MNLASGLAWANLAQIYFSVGILVSFAYALIYFLFKNPKYFSQWERLCIMRLVILLVILLPCLFEILPREKLIRPSVQIWSSRGNSDSVLSLKQEPILEKETGKLSYGIRIPKNLRDLLLAFFLLGIFYGLLRLAYCFYRLQKQLKLQIPFKKFGSLRLLLSPHLAIPYSAQILNRRYVVLPLQAVSDRVGFRMAMAHEIQHHRQNDCLWILPAEFFKAFYFWCPFVHLYFKRMDELQEFACDEHLVLRRPWISPQAYGRCLLQTAQSALESQGLLVGTTGMASVTSKHQLERRIKMLFQFKERKKNRSLAIITLCGTTLFLSAVSYATLSTVQHRALSMGEAKELATRASEGAEIPITVNEAVLKRLNNYVGTPEGRQWFKEAMGRMPQYQSMIERKINEHGLPKELIAIALWESGFKNNLVSSGYKAKGIWQFIAQTARRYHLVVTDELDERLNPEKETEAAMNYLSDLNNMFQDWRLAFKGYNEGEHRLLKLIEKYHTRDPWELERLDSKEGYLSGVMAMMILMKNPSLTN